jgi:GNAT superfamily N-acetyltransferase
VEEITMRAFGREDEDWADRLVSAEFGGRMQARRGELIDALGCPGIVAERAGSQVGLLTYRMDDKAAELVYIEVTRKLAGIGSALLEAFLTIAGGRRVWLVTTNDNLDALRFYQRRGFVICELRPGALDDARRMLKPQIPAFGSFDIPIRDESNWSARSADRMHNGRFVLSPGAQNVAPEHR